MDLQPLGDRLIVEVLEEEETTFSGIVLPDTAKEKPQRGRVLAVGPGNRSEQTGERSRSTSPRATRSSSRSTAAPRSRSAPTSFSSSASRTCSRRSCPRVPRRKGKKALAGAKA